VVASELGAEVDELLDANAAFYAAFEAKDLDAMSRLWERSSRVQCTHPGWATLHGWPSVQAAFYALFSGGGTFQFVLTEAVPAVQGEAGWVTVVEDLLADQAGSTVAALNLFARDPHGRWRMVAHHGSAVHSPPARLVPREGA
jgi:ketosteroid isomerase-like protein